MLRFFCSGLGVMTGALVFFACSSAEEPIAEDTVVGKAELLLVSSPAGLELKAGGPSGYTKAYPNPFGVDSMRIKISAGKIVSSCSAEVRQSSCDETPFSVVISGKRIQVVDLYGVAVLDLLNDEASVPDKVGGDSNDSNPSGEGSTDSNTPSGKGSTDSNTPPGKGSSDSSDGGAPGKGGTDQGGACADYKTKLCKRVSDELSKRKSDFKLDCAKVADGFPISGSLPAKPVSQATPPCHDVIPMQLEGMMDSKCSTQVIAWRTNVNNMLMGAGVCLASPLVLDLDGNGVELSSLENGARFDLLGSGNAVQTAWPSAGDAFLALDRDDNGIVDGATELFGNFTAGKNYNDGFAALAELDANVDGRVDAQDPMFSRLVVWRDADRDGKCRTSEVRSLVQAGLASLDVIPVRVFGPSSFDRTGNQIPLVASFRRTNGSTGQLVDAFLRFKP